MIYSRKSSVLSNDINNIFSKTFGNVGSIFNLTLNQLIKKLFANNEQGFFYDPNDLSTMFQDARGNIPVTAVGQPVGLILDKSKGLAVGGESVVDSGFDDPTKWILVSGTTISGSNLNISSTTNGSSYQNIPSLLSGRLYKVDFDVKSVSGSATFFFGNTSTYSFNSVGVKTIYMLLGTNNNVGFNATTGNAATIGYLSVKEISGNHAYQATSASRPILRQNAVTGAYYLAFDGSDDFLVTNSIDFTTTDKVTLFAGVRKLSDAAPGIVCELSTNSFSADGSFYLATPVTTSPPGTDGFNLRGTKAINKTHITISPASVIYTASGDIGGKAIVFRTNGVTRASGLVEVGAGKLGNYPLYIGRRGGTSLPFNGHLYSLIGIGRLTTDIETIALEKSIAKNVGVSL